MADKSYNGRHFIYDDACRSYRKPCNGCTRKTFTILPFLQKDKIDRVSLSVKEMEDSNMNVPITSSFKTTDNAELNPWVLRALSTAIILKRKLSSWTKSWLYRIYINTVEFCNNRIARWNLSWKPSLFRTRRGRRLIDLLKAKWRT